MKRINHVGEARLLLWDKGFGGWELWEEVLDVYASSKLNLAKGTNPHKPNST